MPQISVTQQVKEIETEVSAILAAGLDSLTRDTQTQAAVLKRNLTDARLDVRDYEYADTREEQLQRATDAKKRLHNVRQLIVGASEQEVFSAADVAQITARIEAVIEQLA